MKIFIPFHIRDIGGPSTFAKKFKEGMESHGHTVVFEEPKDYDILFVIVQAPFDILRRAKKRKKIIIQRLDGVYYWSVASFRFPLYNLKALLIRHIFADYTIYQSRYSKECAERFLGQTKSEQYSIIYNGVNTEQFSPTGETINLRDTPHQKIFFTASDFRRRDQLIPILQALDLYEKKYSSNYKLIVAGSFSRELKCFDKQLERYPKVQYLGKIANADLPKYERGADAFLFTHLNPPCPNNVIEAMACGLPICGIADGAMPELIQHDMEGMLSPASGEALWNRRSYNHILFADNLAIISEKKDRFSVASRKRACEDFSLPKMMKSYIEIFESLLKPQSYEEISR